MNIDATHALVCGAYPRYPACNAGDAAEIAAPRTARPPVERVVEGEVLGRQRERTGEPAESFARRLRMQASAGTASPPHADAGNRDALAVYADIAAAPGWRAPAASIDLYA